MLASLVSELYVFLEETLLHFVLFSLEPCRREGWLSRIFLFLLINGPRALTKKMNGSVLLSDNCFVYIGIFCSLVWSKTKRMVGWWNSAHDWDLLYVFSGKLHNNATQHVMSVRVDSSLEINTWVFLGNGQWMTTELSHPFYLLSQAHPPPSPSLPQPPLCSPNSQKSCDEMRRSGRTYWSILCFVAASVC